MEKNSNKLKCNPLLADILNDTSSNLVEHLKKQASKQTD